MTALELVRKLTEKCVRCGGPASETNLCVTHHREANQRSSKSHSKRRKANRELGLCAFCDTPSETYRCGSVECPGTPRGWRLL